MALTQDQIDFFWQNGYVALGRVLADAELESLRTEYDDIFRRARESDAYGNLAAGYAADAEKKRSAPQQMLQVRNFSTRGMGFRRLLYDPRVLDAAQDLIGANLVLLDDQGLYKPARTGGAVHWHQDNAYWKCRPATLVSCWLTLDDADRENGAMQVAPGSHLKPAWHHPAAEGHTLIDARDQVDVSKVVVVDLPAGGCMFHHCQTLHYTQPNTTDRQRRAWVMHLMPPGTVDGSGRTLRPSFERPILRMSV